MPHRAVSQPSFSGFIRRTPFPLPDEAWGDLALSLGLTERELQIVQGVFMDGTESAIARQLGISTHTVHSHLDRIHRKLGVTSRASLVVRVFAEYVGRSTDPLSAPPL